MRKQKNAGDTFHSLKRERPLPFEFLPASLASGQELGVPVLSLCQTAVRPRHTLLLFFVGPSYLLISTLKQFGKRQFHMRGDTFNLRHTLLPCLFQEGFKHVLVQPRRSFGCGCNGGEDLRGVGGGGNAPHIWVAVKL